MSHSLPEHRPGRTPQRWEPVWEHDVGERMRTMLDQLFGQQAWAAATQEPGGWMPDVDIEEQDESYVVEADLPGVRRDDVNVELVGSELAITGELKDREHTGVVRRRTRRTGHFDIRVSLPDRVDANAVQAELDCGVLTVRIPKAETAQRRRIEVKS